MVLIFNVGFVTFGQLSPGKLSASHAHLEGLSNCTKCHEIGNKVENNKCLACHKELQTRIKFQKGFHSSVGVKSRDCIQCHSEHHGEKFDMIHLDKKSFNHSTTSFPLEGAHKTKIADCKECHRVEKMVNKIFSKKKNTFLGLDARCLSCHDDFHQKNLSENCTSCHEMNSFKEAKKFNHQMTDFVLDGNHKNATCSACHKTEQLTNKKFTKYAGISTACVSCHKDEHKGTYGLNCKICHNTQNFKQITPTKNFNHQVTKFDLEGKHRSVSCQKCHTESGSLFGKFSEFKGKSPFDCNICHKDVHEGKLGTDCKACHNQQSFLLKNKNFVGKFNHEKTDYPLKGKHQRVDCKSCHKSDFTDPLKFESCMSCHKDQHNGDFNYKQNKYADCNVCHQVEGFSPATFGLKEHQLSNYPLDGAHIAQPCSACHRTKNQWKFANIGTACKSCHADTHAGFLDEKFYPEKKCELCHSTKNWNNVSFDHARTDFPLEGVHGRVDCEKCHFIKNDKSYQQVFKGLGKKCLNCHKDVHGGQFELNGETACEKCHSTFKWVPSKFDHQQASFKLDGQHQQVACEKCHQSFLPSSNRIRNYKLMKYECIDCHL